MGFDLPTPSTPPSRLHIRRLLPGWFVLHINPRTSPIALPLPLLEFCLVAREGRSAGQWPSVETHFGRTLDQFAPLRGRACCGFVLKHRPVGPMFQRDDVCLGPTLPSTLRCYRCYFSQTCWLGLTSLLAPSGLAACAGMSQGHKTSDFPENPAFYIVPAVVLPYEGCQSDPACVFTSPPERISLGLRGPGAQELAAAIIRSHTTPSQTRTAAS